MSSASELRQRKGAPAPSARQQQEATAPPSSSAADAQAAAPAAAPAAASPRPINYDAFEALLSTTLVRKKKGGGGELERVPLREALGGDQADAVSLYFSAHWCPPCRAFTPELAQMHDKLTATKQQQSKKRWPVVFVSMDKGAAAFREYFAEMPAAWLAVPFEDDQLRSVLLRKCDVQGIPTLVMLDPQSAAIEAPNARASVSADPDGDVFPWPGARGGGGPGGLLSNPRLLMMVLMLIYYTIVNVLLPWWRSSSGA